MAPNPTPKRQRDQVERLVREALREHWPQPLPAGRQRAAFDRPRATDQGITSIHKPVIGESTMSQPLSIIKQQVCDIGRRVWQRGYCAGNEGNHSVRLGPDRVLCTPTGLSKGFLEPDDLCVVNMQGQQIEDNPRGRKRTSEVLVHLAIYNKFPGVGAVVHSHPPHAVAFCIANVPLPRGVHPEAEIFLGQTVFAHYATPGGPDLPNSFLDQLTEHTNTVLMANHGSISFGKDLIQAYDRLEVLDSYCHQLLLVRQLGRINVLNHDQVADLLKVKQRMGLTDDRLGSGPGENPVPENDAFLAGFPPQPAAARGAHANRDVQPPPKQNDAEFERMVRAITDRVMAALSE